MTTQVLEKPASELTAEELKALLANKEKQEKAAKEEARKNYEVERDSAIGSLISEAYRLSVMLKAFKDEAHKVMEEQAEKLEQYGGIRSNSKGGFSLTDSKGNQRVTRRRDTEPVWDERATKGVDLLKDFLGDTVKKRDLKLYEILIKFLERNEKGDLEYAKVMDLLQHEDKFDDPRWVEGLKLVKEGYSISLKAFGYEFKVKGTDGKWGSLVLNFSSI